MPAAVLQLTSSLGVGGAERLLIDYVAETAGADRGQVVVVMNGGESPAFRRELEATGRPVYFLGRKRGAPTPWTLLDILKVIDRHGVGVVHSHTTGSRLWSYLAKAARPHLKLAHTLHTTGLVGAERRPALYRALVDGTVAISPAVQQGALAGGLKGVGLIENGVALSRFQPRPRTATDETLRILNVGRLSPEKGQDLLLEALVTCAQAGCDFTCRLVGDRAQDRPYDAALDALLAHPLLRDRVTIEGGRTDIPDILPWADLFVLPSRSEGFGLALVEAMAAGLPVIAADVGGPGRILRDHPEAGRLVAPHSPPALAEAILALAADPQARKRMAQAAPLAAADYSIARMAARYEAFYAAL